MKTRTLHRALSMLLTAAIVFNIGLTPVFAAEGVTPPGVSGVCTHHTDHTEDCGYQQGTPCTHEHTDDCYTKELTCKLIGGDAPEIATDSEATLDSGKAPAGEAHTHGEDCYTKTDNCKHTHDEACGYTPDSPCTFDPESCTECKPIDSGKAVKCNCESLCSVKEMNATCTVCGAEGAIPESCKGAPLLQQNGNATYKVQVGTVIGNTTGGEHRYTLSSPSAPNSTEQTSIMAQAGELITVDMYSNKAGWAPQSVGFLNESYQPTEISGCTIERNFDNPKQFTFIMPAQEVMLVTTFGPANTVSAKPYHEPTGNATPASADNSVPAVSYTSELPLSNTNLGAETQFIATTTGSNIDGYLYQFEGGVDYGTVDVSGDYLVYTPNQEAREKTVVLCIKALSEGGVSTHPFGDGGGVIRHTITVGSAGPVLPGDPVTLDISGADKYVAITATGYKVGTEPEIPYTGDYIITGTATGTDAGWNHVTVSGGGTHNITLKDASIQLSYANKAAFVVEGRSTVNLTLSGTNALKSGSNRAGLEVSEGNALTITAASTGSLTANGGIYGAGIGGGNQDAGGTIDISGGTVIANGGEYGAGIGSGEDGAAGTIDISGGTVTATGGASGAGIGGGGYQCDSGKIDISGGTVTATGGWNSAGIGGSEHGAGGTITISGGTVTATGHVLSAGIGGGMGGAGGTVTIRENAVVFATGGFGVPDHIGEGLNGSAGTVNRNGGILFEGTEGLLYGTNVTPTANFTIPGTNTLTIAAGKTLTMNTGITVTNNGTITNSGTITNNGTLKALGIQSGTGTLTGNGIVQMNLSDSMVTLPQSSYAYTGSPIVPAVTVSPTILWGKSIALKKDTDYTVTGSNNTAVSVAATVIVTPKGGNSALTGTAVEKTFDITTANSALALITNKVGNTVTYGDTITFTANLSIPATKARAASANTVEFFCKGTSLGTANLIESGGTGSASFTYDTTGKSIPIGTQTITAQYGGSGNLNGQTASITVSLNKKAITSAAVNAGQSKDYDGNSNFTGVLITLNTSDILGGDTVTAKANGTMSNKDVGTHSFTCTSVTLGGAHSGYYSLAHSAVTGNVEIKAIAPVYNVADQKIKINRTLTAIQAAKTAAGVNSETVAGTLTWAESSGGNALSDSYSFTGNAGDIKTLYWTFKPTSGNYNTLSGSTVFTLTEKEVPVLTINNIEKTYDGKAVTTVTGIAKVDSTTVAGTFAFDGTPTMKNAGIYNVTVKFTPNDTESYKIATTSITVTVNKATVGIALNLSKDRITAGEPLPTPSIAYSGLVSGESLTPATAPIFAGMPSGSTEGTYTITWSNKTTMQSEIEALPAYQNYTANYKDNVTLTIDKKSGGGGGTGGGSTGGGNSGGGETTPPTPPNQPIIEDTNAKINSDKDGNVTAKADDKEIAKAIETAQKADKGNGIAITLNVKTKDDIKPLAVTLSAATMIALTNAKVAQLTINNGLTTITLDLAALKALAGGDVILTVSKVDVKTLSAEAQNAISSRPVFHFEVTVGGKAVSDFKGGRVGLQMPYTRTTTEQAGNLVGVYVDGSGKVTWLENSSYDSLTGTLLTSTTHFSVFGVGYKAATAKFADVGTHWAKNDIDFVVARGLLTGTSNTTFAPDTSMTRGMFVTALGRLAGVDTKKYQRTKFTDVAATAYYSPYVAWASANNIVNSTSDTTFSPDKAISRQEMAVMLVNYSKVIGYDLPSVHAEVTFTDAGSITSWAKDAVKQTQMAGILMGKSDNRFDPTATATRAEVSAMLRRYVELVVNTETAEGWAMNESGQWMYIQDGKRVTGKKTIDGKSYTFDQLGVTTALPPERKYLAYTVQAGDSFWRVARKYKVSMFELAAVNGKTIFSVIHVGDELKVPQK